MFFKLVLFEELAAAGAPFGPLAGCWQTADAIIEYGTERAAARAAARRRPRRGHVLAGLQRAGRRLRSALAHHRGQARRRFLDHPRPQDLVEPRRASPLTASSSRAPAARPGAAAASACSWCPTARPACRSGRSGASPARSITTRSSWTTCACPPTRCSGPEGEGFQALLNGLDSDRFWGRYYKAPALERVLRQLVDYANTTRANGAPLARDPGVRRRLAAMATDIAALRDHLLSRRVPAPRRRARSPTRRRSPRSWPTSWARSWPGWGWTCWARGHRCARARGAPASTAGSRTTT